MAYPTNPDDPYRTNPRDEEIRRAERFDNDLQPDPELAETPASGGRIALYALAIVVVLGAAVYGFSHSSTQQAGTTPASQTAQTQSGTPPAPPGMRDVTPKANPNSGVTTGSAINRPTAPPSPPADNSVAPPAQPNGQR